MDERAFRSEFPFLDQPGCPIELEALVTRKFTAYNTYVRLYGQLRDSTSLQECADKARQLIDAYVDNRMIWDELTWYKQHGTILGKHPAFAEFRRRDELKRLPLVELFKRQQQVKNNIWRVKSEMAKGDKPHLDGVRKQRLDGYERELADIERLLA